MPKPANTTPTRPGQKVSNARVNSFLMGTLHVRLKELNANLDELEHIRQRTVSDIAHIKAQLRRLRRKRTP